MNTIFTYEPRTLDGGNPRHLGVGVRVVVTYNLKDLVGRLRLLEVEGLERDHDGSF